MKALVLAAKAFADSTRVRILGALEAGELCVCELCDVLGVTQSTLSTHLQVIRQAGLVTARKQGKWMYYAIAPEAALAVEFLFRTFASEGDAVLRQDQAKLKQRLAMRDGGDCCVGFKTGASGRGRRCG